MEQDRPGLRDSHELSEQGRVPRNGGDEIHSGGRDQTRFTSSGAVPPLTSVSNALAAPSASDLGYGRAAHLAADMTTEHEPKTAALPEDKHQYKEMLGIPFVRGEGDKSDVDPNDVNQGSLGDCWFLSGVAAVARANPEAIRRLIVDNGDGTYDVTLFVRDHTFGAKTKHVFRIDSNFPTNGSTAAYAQGGDKTVHGNAEQWVMLLEKAYATYQGSYKGKFAGMDGGQSTSGLDALLPTSPTMYFPFMHSTTHIAHQIAHALKEHRPVTASASKVLLPSTQKRADALGLADMHVFSVKSVDEQAMTISLQNPWGYRHLENLSMEDFKHFFNQYGIGPSLAGG